MVHNQEGHFPEEEFLILFPKSELFSLKFKKKIHYDYNEFICHRVIHPFMPSTAFNIKRIQDVPQILIFIHISTRSQSYSWDTL